MNRATSATGWVRNPDGTLGWTWNPFTGCRNHVNGLCKGGGFPCYAYRLAHGRLKQRYLANKNGLPYSVFERGLTEELKAEGDPFYPRFWPERLAEMTKRNDRFWADKISRPRFSRTVQNALEYHAKRGIFVCDMSDLFGIGIPEEWTRKVLDEIWGNKGIDRFYLLTKQPQNLVKWSPFPDNVYIGVTATNTDIAVVGLTELLQVQATVKFISFEPLLEAIPLNEIALQDIDWLIIGAQTKPYKPPKIEWVKEIVEAADQAGVKVFLKDNLKPLVWNEKERVLIPNWARMHGEYDGLEGFELRQEMPKGEGV